MAISKVKLPDNSVHEIHDSRLPSVYPRIYVGTCSTAAATAAKVVTTEEFPLVNGNPVVGTTIAVKFTNTNSGASPTLNVNGTGAHSIYYSTAVYTSSSSIAGYANRYTYYVWDGTYWVWLNHGTDNDNNTLAYNVRYNAGTRVVTDHTARYRILFSSADDQKWVPANSGTSANATDARTVNQTKINPFGQIVYYATTTVLEANGTPAASTLYTQYAPSFGYSFNRTGAALTLTAKAPIYIKCAPQTDGSAIIDADTPYVQALPSTDDGKIYIYLGIASSATAVELSITHPVYYSKDGQIRLWTNGANTDISGKQDKWAEVGTLEGATVLTPTSTVGAAVFVDGEQTIGLGYMHFVEGEDLPNANTLGIDSNGLKVEALDSNGGSYFTFNSSGLAMHNTSVTGLPTPTANDEAATKGYVDTSISGLATVASTGSYSDLSNKPTNLSDFTNDSGFITKAVNDLTNYYTKNQTYTQTEVNNLISSISTFKWEIYASISAVTSPSSNVLYLIGPTGTGSDRYEEYVYTNNAFVKIGDTSIDLSGKQDKWANVTSVNNGRTTLSPINEDGVSITLTPPETIGNTGQTFIITNQTPVENPEEDIPFGTLYQQDNRQLTLGCIGVSDNNFGMAGFNINASGIHFNMLGASSIDGVPTPTNFSDAVNKGYVDAAFEEYEKMYAVIYNNTESSSCTTWQQVQNAINVDTAFLYLYDENIGGFFLPSNYDSSDHITFSGIYNGKLREYTLSSNDTWTVTETAVGIFEAVQNVTLASEIETALDAGKVVVAKDTDNNYYSFIKYNESGGLIPTKSAYFSRIERTAANPTGSAAVTNTLKLLVFSSSTGKTGTTNTWNVYTNDLANATGDLSQDFKVNKVLFPGPERNLVNYPAELSYSVNDKVLNLYIPSLVSGQEETKTLAFTEDIPTSLSQLSADSTHRVVTDAEKATWNAKADIFVANITTTYAEIAAAVAAGKTVLCKFDLENDDLTSMDDYEMLLGWCDEGVLYGQLGHKEDDAFDFICLTNYGPDAYFFKRDNTCWYYIKTGVIPTPVQFDRKYVKPDNGIPKSDLASSVQITLNKADSAYQKPSTGIPASDIAAGVIPTSLSQLSADSTHRLVTDTEKSTWNAKYTKPSTGIPASDLAAGVIPSVPVQDVTVGGTSVVSGGTAVIPAIPTVPTISTNVVTDKASDTKTSSPKSVYDEIHPATQSSQPAGGFLPNVIYNLGTLSGNTTFALATPADSSVANHYYWTFDTGSTAPTITWPASITGWNGGSAPTINASKHYEISVLNGIGAFMEV